MNEPTPPCARGFRQRPAWLLAVVGLMLAQAYLALQVLGGGGGLADARPVVSGRHPLHLYHGTLGAATFRQRSATACYDPNFQAGYPKTPVFDGSCRPAEFFLLLLGDGYDPAAYKLGLFCCCLAVPLGFVAAARGAGLSRAAAILAGALGCGVWWSPPARAMFDAGDLDLMLAGLSATVFIGWLARYHWQPGVTSWCVLAGTAVVGWYAHPVVWLALGPVVAVYYLAIAPQHGLAWHLGIVGVTGVGMGPNFWWLWDWIKFWWLRQPSVDDIAPLPTWGALLGSTSDNADLLGWHPLGLPLVGVGILGLVRMFATGKRTAPMLFTASALFALAVARFGQVWPTMASGGAERAAPLVPALALVPAVAFLAAHWERFRAGRVALFASCGLPALAALVPAFGLNLAPIPLGLSDDQHRFARGLKELTTDEARILIEDADRTQPGWNWMALLPELTGRAYLGGLDPDARFEHSFAAMKPSELAGRRYDDWTDADLAQFGARYNIGWVAARTARAAERWRKLPGTTEVGRFRDGGDVILFRLARTPSFILKGSARWVSADRRKVVLMDLVPAADGTASVVVLSLHYQAGWCVSPAAVQVERDQDAYDPIPMIRLRVPGPMSRVVLTWENP